MKCKLCGQPPTEPTGLCQDCSRALTRAREGAAALRNLPSSGARIPRAVSRIVLKSPAAPMSAVLPPRRRLALWGALAVVAVALLYLGDRNASPLLAQETRMSDRALRIYEAQTEGTYVDDNSDDPKLLPVPRRAGSGAQNSPRPLPQVQPQSAARPGRSTPSTQSGAATNSSSKKAGASEQNAGAGSPVGGTDTDTATQLARVNLVAPVAPPDEATLLAGALEKCSNEKFLAGVICEQKVRLRFCEGKWGQTPQCTAKPRVD